MTTNNKNFKVKTAIDIDGASGDEGGQVNLAKPITNTTLGGKVVIDVNQNRLRIFEDGGTNRGAYIDLTSATGSIGTNLLGGGSSLVVQDGTPSTTDVLWLDTDEPSATMIPTGGTTGQVLSKINSTDYNTQWVTQNSDSRPDIFMLMGG